MGISISKKEINNKGMPLSQFIDDLLKSNEQVINVFNKEGFEEKFTPQYRNELIQEADEGNEQAQYYVGTHTCHNKCIFFLFKILGFMYGTGAGGVPLDYHKAAGYTLKAADQGHSGAQAAIGIYVHTNVICAHFGIGWMYYNGKGVPQDYNMAIDYYIKSANQGNASAQNSTGTYFI